MSPDDRSVTGITGTAGEVERRRAGRGVQIESWGAGFSWLMVGVFFQFWGWPGWRHGPLLYMGRRIVSDGGQGPQQRWGGLPGF